ncbi:hypothetical protein KUCAC02_027966, partial [Chaenocephalus aceratus]
HTDNHISFKDPLRAGAARWLILGTHNCCSQHGKEEETIKRVGLAGWSVVTQVGST